MTRLLAIILLTLFSATALAESPIPVIRPFTHAEPPVPVKTPTAPWVEPMAGQMCNGPNDGIKPTVPTPLGLLLEGGPNEDEARMVETAIDGCRQTNRKVADPWLVLALLRIEQDMELPIGILAATWCREASMRTEMSKGGPIRGDWMGSHSAASGPFQTHEWFWRWCGADNRAQSDDIVWAARCYASRIIAMLPKASRLCHGDAAWAMSEAMTANAPRYNWGKGLRNPCSVKSEHWRILESWRHDEKAKDAHPATGLSDVEAIGIDTARLR